MEQKFIVVIDYKKSGIHCYPYYLYENALSCYQSHLEDDDILLSVSLMKIEGVGDFITLMSKTWR